MNKLFLRKPVNVLNVVHIKMNRNTINFQKIIIVNTYFGKIPYDELYK